jgi:hypothetical protein
MGRGKKKKDAKEQTFKRLFGVDRETFENMKSILQKEYDRQHQKGGSPAKLSIEDKPDDNPQILPGIPYHGSHRS